MIIAILAIRAAGFVVRSAAELAALGLFITMIAVWSAIAAGA